jgi:hypothetical protein
MYKLQLQPEIARMNSGLASSVGSAAAFTISRVYRSAAIFMVVSASHHQYSSNHVEVEATGTFAHQI